MNGTSHRGHDAPSQVTIVTPNGFTVSIIDDGYGEDGRPFEAYVTMPDGGGMPAGLADSMGSGIMSGKSDGGGIFGWLSSKDLGALLWAVSDLRLTEVPSTEWRWA